MPFNKDWAFNVGLKHATTDVIVFGDCDLIMDPQKMINALRMLDQYECVSPYSRVIDLNQNEVNLPLEELSKIEKITWFHLWGEKANYSKPGGEYLKIKKFYEIVNALSSYGPNYRTIIQNIYSFLLERSIELEQPFEYKL